MTFNLLPLNILRPEKITWRFPYQGGDILEYLKSKTLKSFLKNCDKELLEFQISWEEKEMDYPAYLEWLVYYQEKMIEQGFDVIARPEWWQEKTDQGKTVHGSFFIHEGKIIGSQIYTLKETEIAAGSFKASDRLDQFSKKRNSIGAVIDYFFIRKAIQLGVKIISFGQSRNAFGVISTLGQLDYKLRFGMKPNPSPNTQLNSEVPLAADGTVVFFGLKNQKFTLFGVKPKTLEMTFEAARFATPELPFELIEY